MTNPNLANANTPEPSPNIPPDPNEGKLQWDEGFIQASSEHLKESSIRRYEILVPYSIAPTLQTAVKKTAAILLAHSNITIVPHVDNTSRNNVSNESPIEKIAMRDYIFDTGKEFHNEVTSLKQVF